MASATIELPRAAKPAALPAFWRQPHVYVLSGTVALHVALSRGLLVLADTISAQGSEGLFVGALFGQCFLLGLWGALGGLSTLPRWALLGAIYLAGVAAISIRMPAYSDDPWSQALEWGIIGAVLVLLFVALLLPLRRLAGWRVDFDPRFYRDSGGRRGQLTFLDYACYSVTVAAALAALRLSIQADVLGPEMLVTVFGVIAVVAIAAAPPAYLLVVGRRLWLAIVGTLAWALVASAIHSWLSFAHEALDLFGPASGPQLAGVRLHLVSFYGGVTGLVGVTFVALRLFGLQLIVVGRAS